MSKKPVDGAAAGKTLLSWKTCTPGYCLKYVWDAYAAHGATSDKSYPTAMDGWYGSPGKHEGDRNPPRGAAVWLGVRSDSNAGDVVISLGNGMVAATDWPSWGVIGQCTLDQRIAQTGRPYLGWTETILGYPIDYGQDDDMPSADEVAKAVWNYGMSGADKNNPQNDVPSETAGERLRNIRRSTDGLKSRTERIDTTTKSTASDVSDVVEILDQLGDVLGRLRDVIEK